MNRELTELWIDSGFANLSKFNKFVRNKTGKFSYKDIKNFYNEQRTQQLHKPIKEDTSKYKPIVTFKKCFDWQLDLLDMQKYSKYNRGYRWIMICVDVFTRKAYCRALKKKTTGETSAQFLSILKESGCIPSNLTTDDGNEYKGEFKKVLNKKNINHRVAEVGFHRTLGVIDRFSRTIKTILAKMFTELNMLNWYDYLDKMCEAYSNRPHNGICGISPNEAEKNNEFIFQCHLNKVKNVKPFTLILVMLLERN